MTDVTDFFGIRTRSPHVLAVIERIRRIADIHVPVLVQGETGTGKELIARALHSVSSRRGGPLVTVNCGSVPAGLVESELFGHERGAFTGADRAFGGRVQAAAEGTLFLDEINSLPLEGQAKLLRFLESGEVSRVGRARPVSVDARVVSAANVSLTDEVANGRMREDFFHRLDVLRIDVPPLRERLEDLPLLVQQYLEEDVVAARLGVIAAHPDVLSRLASYGWPGNVRELRNVVRRALVFGSNDGILVSVELPTDEPSGRQECAYAASRTTGSLPRFRKWMMDREREYLAELQRQFSTASERAAAAGLPVRTLYRKMRGLRDLGATAPRGARGPECQSTGMSTT